MKVIRMNIFEAYNSTKKALENAGIEDYVFEAKQIIKHITGFSSSEILMNYTNQLTGFQRNNLTALIKQRELRYPLQYIFGEWSFYGLDFFVGPGVLVPRADTETLVETGLDYLKDRTAPQILDLCAGSGCIGITLAKKRADSTCLMVEKFPEAMRYAEKNIVRNKTENARVINGDIFEGAGCGSEYDLIISNPPYIPEGDMNTVSPETRYEPETALVGGTDGLDFYRAVIGNYKQSLKEGGMMAFEIGIGQADAVAALLNQAGLVKTDFKNDFNGIKRVVFALK